MEKAKIIKLTIGKEINGHEVRELVASYRRLKSQITKYTDEPFVNGQLLGFIEKIKDLIKWYS